MDIDQGTLKAFLSYDPETGVFTRVRTAAACHARLVGKPSGSRNKVSGYVEIHVGGAKYNAHRLAWIYVNGAVPEGMTIDHVNRDRSDNRIDNLRPATHASNLQNCKTRVDNTSGVKGVSFDRRRGKWVASVSHKYVGRFDSLAEAAAARANAAQAVFGEFATESPTHHASPSRAP